jgi:hypothetical protein
MMFANRVVFGPSAFSPQRKPMVYRYQTGKRQATKPAKSTKAVAQSVDITNVLGTDELDSVMMAVYQCCKSAPMCAAVSHEFKRAKEVAEEDSKVLNVAPLRFQMKLASKPSLIPKAAKDDAIIGKWGKSLKSFERKDGVSSVDKDDMQRILDVKGAKGGGWLTNAAADAYLSTLMPSVAEAEPEARRVFLPGVHSHTLENTGTLGFSSENWSVNKSGDYVMKKDVAATVCNRARTSCVLLGADELYVNYNVKNFHWGLMRVLLKYQRCEIYDSTGHTKKEHGRNLLRGIQELTGVDTSAWSIVVYETPASGMAQQHDGKSCGVFLCITAAHLVCDAKLPDIQADIVAWRRHIATSVV